MRTVWLFVGISGFIMISLGIVLLVLRYPMLFPAIGLIVFGTGLLVAFFCPHQEKRLLLNVILLNLAMIFLMLSGLISYNQAEAFLRAAGIVFFSLGLLLIGTSSVFLASWIISETDPGKQESMYRDMKKRILEDILKKLFE